MRESRAKREGERKRQTRNVGAKVEKRSVKAGGFVEPRVDVDLRSEEKITILFELDESLLAALRDEIDVVCCVLFFVFRMRIRMMISGFFGFFDSQKAWTSNSRLWRMSMMMLK